MTISKAGQQSLDNLRDNYQDCMVVYVDGDTVVTSGEMRSEQIQTLIKMLETAIIEKPGEN